MDVRKLRDGDNACSQVGAGNCDPGGCSGEHGLVDNLCVRCCGLFVAITVILLRPSSRSILWRIALT